MNLQIVPLKKTNMPQANIEAILTNLAKTKSNLELATTQELLDTTDEESFDGFLKTLVEMEENQQNDSPENDEPRITKDIEQLIEEDIEEAETFSLHVNDASIEPVNLNENLEQDMERNIANLIAEIRRNPDVGNHNNIDNRHIDTEFT